MDLFRGLLGDAAWCFARVTEAGRPVVRADVRQGAEGLGLLAGDRIDAMYGFSSPPVAHFATARPKQPGQRFGLQVLGSKGRIELGTGWLAPAHLLPDPAWSGVSGRAKWVEITGAGVGKPETFAGDGLAEANRAIVADLVHAVETDTQPRASAYDGRAAVEMILACYASHVRKATVQLPLDGRGRHPLETIGA
jgi:predicted dehydrogenase